MLRSYRSVGVCDSGNRPARHKFLLSCGIWGKGIDRRFLGPGRVLAGSLLDERSLGAVEHLSVASRSLAPAE